MLIDRRQLRLLAINLLYMSLIVLVFCLILFAPVAFVFYDSHASFEQQDQAADHLLLLHKTVWPAVLVVFGLFCLHSIVYSHRILGPLYRFRLVFDRVLNGDLTMRANLREKDLLQLEARLINSMLDGLSARLERISGKGATARASLAHAASLAARDGSTEMARALDCIAAGLDELHDEIMAFQLPERDAENLDPLVEEMLAAETELLARGHASAEPVDDESAAAAAGDSLRSVRS